MCLKKNEKGMGRYEVYLIPGETLIPGRGKAFGRGIGYALDQCIGYPRPPNCREK